MYGPGHVPADHGVCARVPSVQDLASPRDRSRPSCKDHSFGDTVKSLLTSGASMIDGNQTAWGSGPIP